MYRDRLKYLNMEYEDNRDKAYEVVTRWGSVGSHQGRAYLVFKWKSMYESHIDMAYDIVSDMRMVDSEYTFDMVEKDLPKDIKVAYETFILKEEA